MNQYSILRWPCAYDNCPEILNDVDHTISRKYCDIHQKIRTKEQNKINCATYYKKNPRRRARNCVVCGTKLETATKYCSKLCHSWMRTHNKQKKNMVGLCHLCYSSNISISIVNGKSFCENCLKKQDLKNITRKNQ